MARTVVPLYDDGYLIERQFKKLQLFFELEITKQDSQTKADQLVLNMIFIYIYL